MFPYRDANPSESTPIVTIGLIAVNVGAFLWELSLGDRIQSAIYAWGVVPNQGFRAMSYFSSMFLHGGWFHVASNMGWLWIFGDNVEDRLGHFRVLLFYFACGLAAGITHTAFNLASPLPAVGASGAVAGVLGAYLVLFPKARVLTLVPLFLYYEVVELPAFLVLGFWFLAQFLNGTATIAMTSAAAGVAWWAHIGGFLAGIAFLFLLLPSQNPKNGYNRKNPKGIFP